MKKKFKYNPFSGVLAEDIKKIVVPKFELNKIIEKINNTESLALEFVGRHGRGKTTHLIYLQQQMSEYPIFFIKQNASISEILNHKSDIVFC